MDNEAGNVIYLKDRRPAPASVVPCEEADAHATRDTVFFVTGGRYECMVNNAVGLVGSGEFLRVPTNAVYSFAEIGPSACSMVSHKFMRTAPSGLLREIAEALPAFAQHFPRRGTPAFARLEMIARRWGYRLDSGAAA